MLYRFLLLAGLGFNVNQMAMAENPDTVTCLVIQGTFENAFYKSSESCTVEVLRDGVVQATLKLTRMRRKFWYPFERDCCYTLRVTKSGFATMLISVDTRRADRSDALYQLDFTARLITNKRAKTMNQDALNIPYAHITYDESAGVFLADQKYTEKVKAELVLRGKML